MSNNKFDELAKGLASSVTRRQALKKFGLGLAGIMLACFGLRSASAATKTTCYCQVYIEGFGTQSEYWALTGNCMDSNTCITTPSASCPAYTRVGSGSVKPAACGGLYAYTTKYKCSC